VSLPRTESTPFDRRIARFLAGVAVASFVAGILLAILGGHVDEVESSGADTFSRSAVGHRALLETLRRLDVPLLVSRFETARKAGPGTVLVLIEPRNHQLAATMLREAQTDRVVLVLPKWDAPPDARKPGHVREVYFGVGADRLLGALEIEAATHVVEARVGVVATGGLPTPTPAAEHLQGVDGIEPLVSAGGFALVGRTRIGDKDAWVVADPDLTNSAGLGLGENAALTLEILGRAAQGGRTLVIDETANGYVRPPEVWSALFEFPLVLVVFHALLLLGALLWAAMRRFGAPRPSVPVFARGGEALMESTAALMRYGGHSGHALREYWRAALRQMREATGAPAGLGHDELLAWLDRIAGARGIETSAGRVAAQVRDAASSGRGEAVADAARRVHAYRERLLGVRE